MRSTDGEMVVTEWWRPDGGDPMVVTDEMRRRYRDAHRRVQDAMSAAISADRDRERAERALRALKEDARVICAQWGDDPLALTERIGDGPARPVLRLAPIDLPSAQPTRRDTAASAPQSPAPQSPAPQTTAPSAAPDPLARLIAALGEVLPTSAPGLSVAAGVDLTTARDLIRQLSAAGVVRSIGRRRDPDGVLLTTYDLVER